MSEDLSVGLFPVRYLVGTGLPGAPQLVLALMVDSVDHGGRAREAVSAAGSPPLHFHA
ncbi:hypothetical protein CF645_38535, partial [Burkholderia pseudomallei]|uniref:DUF1842 domain-containing protein n=1 Tax=Burkholderia pseudomallei TaxID=28450 RepID=UPI000CCF2438